MLGVNLFQFLMVRLKVKGISTRKSYGNTISIPYGAIKRVPPILKSSEVNIFQFLMVRLKV